MVVAAGREEGGLLPERCDQLEAEDVAVEGHGAVEVGHLEVDVTDIGLGVQGHGPLRRRECADVSGISCPAAEIVNHRARRDDGAASIWDRGARSYPSQTPAVYRYSNEQTAAPGRSGACSSGREKNPLRGRTADRIAIPCGEVGTSWSALQPLATLVDRRHRRGRRPGVAPRARPARAHGAVVRARGLALGGGGYGAPARLPRPAQLGPQSDRRCPRRRARAPQRRVLGHEHRPAGQHRAAGARGHRPDALRPVDPAAAPARAAALRDGARDELHRTAVRHGDLRRSRPGVRIGTVRALVGRADAGRRRRLLGRLPRRAGAG